MEALVRDIADTATTPLAKDRAQKPCIRLIAPMRKFDPAFPTMVGASAYGWVRQENIKGADVSSLMYFDITMCPEYVENLAINTVLISTTFHGLLGDKPFMPPKVPEYRKSRPAIYEAWPPLLFTKESFAQSLAVTLREKRFDQIVVIGGIEQLETIVNMTGDRDVYLQPLWLKDTKYAKGVSLPTNGYSFSNNLNEKSWSDDALYCIRASAVTA